MGTIEYLFLLAYNSFLSAMQQEVEFIWLALRVSNNYINVTKMWNE